MIGSMDSCDHYIEKNRTRFEDTLGRLVEMKTVSADSSLRDQVIAGANLAASLLEEAGLKARIIQTDGNPVAFASKITDPNAPTVLIYNHLDVQPADIADWQTDPFKFTVAGDKYFGRGATDDKGPAVTALLAVTYAISNNLPLNFKFAWELEEEIGSPHFEQFVSSNTGELAADLIVISDTIWVSGDKPAIPIALRGLLTFELSLTTGTKDVHSGLAGGAMRNPLLELSALITACCDSVTGRVLIPGFYDAVQKVPESESSAIAESGFTIEGFKADHGLKLIRAGSTAEIASRIMVEPTFEVHGIVGGYIGPGVKTVIPPAAVAKISTRLAVGQSAHDVYETIKKFVTAKNPDVKINLEAAAEPYYSDPTGFYATAASEAISSAFGVKPVFIREGGSIGAVLTLDHYLKAPVVMLGLSLPEHGYHAPDEHYDWRQASGGMKMFIKYFEAVAHHGKS
jgi:acetylornithine deacetylase/succinyl-diaminopimelate desuccinylase-like protein